jgi:hypothetical protein
MNRLFLASALVLHLSGVCAVAAVVRTQPGMPLQSCCCHHSAPGQRSSSQRPVATPTCPCNMAPQVPAPVTPTPATVSSSRNPLAAAGLVCTLTVDAVLPAALLPPHQAAIGDLSPPYLTAAHPRC